jgi:NAD(P)-dependent dehydrogenase (short-subunit alcohol dehydrogenase family)
LSSQSAGAAQALVEELLSVRADSAQLLGGDLGDAAPIAALAAAAQARWGRLHALVNNASSYFPTPLGAIAGAQLDDLLGSNLRAPLLLTQACAPLFSVDAAVVNLLDTQTPRPQPPYAVYHAAKAGLWSLTESLATCCGRSMAASTTRGRHANFRAFRSAASVARSRSPALCASCCRRTPPTSPAQSCRSMADCGCDERVRRAA